MLDTTFSMFADVKFESSPSDDQQTASTDAGDVSHILPTIHPMFALSTTAKLHSVQFQEAAGTMEAHERALTAGKSLALTCLEVIRDGDLLQKIKEEFSCSR